jgi:hypothetical protein
MEEHAAEKAKIVREMKLKYPVTLRKYNLLKQKQLPRQKLQEGDYVIFLSNSFKKVGKIQSIDETGINVFEYSLGSTDENLHLCELNPVNDQRVTMSDILVRCTVLKKTEESLYLNHFSLMFNTCKFK